MARSALRIALAQVNPTVGDLSGNVRLIERDLQRARAEGAELVVFPELVLTGYPPEDLLLRPDFLTRTREALDGLAAEIHDVVALVGFPHLDDDLYNALAVCSRGTVLGVYRKMLRPNYGVFDEHRYFGAGTEPAIIEVGDVKVGLTICEDIWEPGLPETAEAAAGASVIVNASASPYQLGKAASREQMIAQRAEDARAVIAYCNMVGGQDELVFDGRSVVMDERGQTIAAAPQFAEALLLCDIEPHRSQWARLRSPGFRSVSDREAASVRTLATLDPRPAADGDLESELAEPLPRLEEVYAALRLGLGDYVTKNGFTDVVLGLSGGIDSALVALVAADALGAEHVHCVVMPSAFSSDDTQSDAMTIAENLGAPAVELPIEGPRAAFGELLAEPLAGADSGLAGENVQARIRGTIVMALSNAHNWLALATGNKSEMSVGYATLYGDMAGGFAPIKDVPKLVVYELVRHRNDLAGRELVPASVIDRPPTAELAHDQLDSDTLPPYEVLDAIIDAYVVDDLSPAEIEQRGHDRAVVADVIRRIDLAEHKRRQAAPGVKITSRAYVRDRRRPITNRYSAGAP
ncbi:MAG: NAD+ synthase [Solirubrobacterales bacterium]